VQVYLTGCDAATLAVADGDYTVALPSSGRDEVGRLEANFTAMTRQLGSALAAERQQDGHVELAIRDGGSGFDPAAPPAGSGLAHIRDRVAELGGTVDIDSAPGRGATLTIRVPVP